MTDLTSTVPKAPVSWPTLILAITTAVFGTLHLAGPSPAPVPPVPVPAPVPAPVPTPAVDPPPIRSGLTVTDTKGVALGNSVSPGVMFLITGPTGTRLTGVPSTATDADVAQVSDNKLVVTLRNGCILHVVVSPAGEVPTLVAIVCNHAPQPPPVNVDPPPTPVVPVVPPPVIKPSTKTVHIGIVEGDANRPFAMSQLLSNHAYWDKYRKAGIVVNIWDKKATTPAALQEIKDLQTAGVTLPGVILRDSTGTVQLVNELPKSTDACTATFSPFTGIQ